MGNFHTDVLRDVIVFSNSTSLWSGRGKLTAEDLGDEADKLPPAALASLGSKRLFPKDEIRKLETFKRKIARIIGAYGTPFLTGRAVPVPMAEACARELDAVVADARKAVDAFMAEFDSNLRDWHASNAQWRHLLAAGTPEREAVRKRINFGYDAYPVGVPDGELLAERMSIAVGELGSGLLHDIAKDARDFCKKALTNREVAASQKTVNPIRRLLQKLKSLSFLNHRALPVLNVGTLLVDQLPKQGKLTESDYLLLVQLAHMLSDVSAMEAFADEVIEGHETVEGIAQRICGREVSTVLVEQGLQISGGLAGDVEASSVVDAASLFAGDKGGSDAVPEALQQERDVAAQPLPTLPTKSVVAEVLEVHAVIPTSPSINAMRVIRF